MLPSLPPSPGVSPDRLRSHADLRLEAADRILALFIGFRAYGSPVLATAAVGFAFLDPTPWRRIALVLTGALIVAFSVVELARFRRLGPRAFDASADLLVVIVAQLALVFATGGLASPLAPPVVLVAFLQGLLARSPRHALRTAGIQVPAIWGMAAAHAGDLVPGLVPAFLVGHLAPAGTGPGPWVFAAVLTVPIVVAPQVASRIRSRLDDTYLHAITARDRSLELYQSQAEAMTRLSAEIAHELKNPLASIKGLGGLLASRARGADAERLAVLRREADRMQRVLDEMLEFGRPLSPLAPDTVDLAELAREVATVHEGLAAARGVQVRAPGHAVPSTKGGPQGTADGPAAPARCDPSKVLQILTNLVQNALEATPRGGRVEVFAAPGRLRVIDDGPGLSPEVGGRAFEAGVSTKARGTGLGLTIARTLARQHGGELRLGPRRDGRPGTEAVLELPVDDPGDGASSTPWPWPRSSAAADGDPPPAGDDVEAGR